MVLYYNAQNKSWLPAGQGPSRVELYRDAARAVYRVVARNVADMAVRPWRLTPSQARALTSRSPRTPPPVLAPPAGCPDQVVINSQLYVNLEYRRATDTFHQWQDARYVYGLHFGSKEEAAIFGTAMDKALVNISNAGALCDSRAPRERKPLTRMHADVCRLAAAGQAKDGGLARDASGEVSTRRSHCRSFSLSSTVVLVTTSPCPIALPHRLAPSPCPLALLAGLILMATGGRGRGHFCRSESPRQHHRARRCLPCPLPRPPPRTVDRTFRRR